MNNAQNPEKIIYASLYDPRDQKLFKTDKRTDRATFTKILCKKSESCDLYKKGQCVLMNFFSSCIYGRERKEEGPTKRSSSLRSWIDERKDTQIRLNSAPRMMAVVGDYIYLPYSYMKTNPELTFMGDFVKSGDFTAENIQKIISFIPRTQYGNEELKEYQGEVVPKFIKHLKQTFPRLFEEVAILVPAIQGIANTTNVGRKAYLKTLTPNQGSFKDIHGGVWSWDGVYLISANSQASFLLVKSFSELRVKPSENEIVQIESDDQVSEKTIFAD